MSNVMNSRARRYRGLIALCAALYYIHVNSGGINENYGETYGEGS